MSSLMKWYFIFVLLLSTSCRVDKSGAEIKHITYDDPKHGVGALHGKLAAAKIFADSWKIGFYVQGECGWDQRKQISEIKSELVNAVDKWLEPLRERAAQNGRGHEVVSNISAEQVDAEDYEITAHLESKRTRGPVNLAFEAETSTARASKKKTTSDPYVFTVFFYCTLKYPESPKGGGAFALITDNENIVAGNPEIHIFLPVCDDESSSVPDPSSNTIPCPPFYGTPFLNPIYGMKHVPVSKFVLLHEIGHVMGLLDTYDQDGDIKYEHDEWMYVANIPGQPDSVMSFDTRETDEHGNPALAQDDKNGMHDLYDKFKAAGFYNN